MFLLINSFFAISQNNKITINAELDFTTKEIQIQQEITYFNTSGSSLDTLYFHNWSAAYKDRKTPLSKRLIEDYDKSLYFSKAIHRGSSIIKNVSSNYSDKWFVNNQSPDIIGVALNKPLSAKDSLVLSFNYIVKIPAATFTGYGKKTTTYNLRFWYISPAVLDDKWQIMSNLNMDDLYISPSDYDIKIALPQGMHINTDLEHTKTTNPPFSVSHLKGKSRTDIELNLNVVDDFTTFKTTPQVITNLNNTELSHALKTTIISRELGFIEKHLGKYPFDKLLINKISYDKNPIYGLNQLPKMFNPFSGTFEWDIKMFKALTRNYLEKTIIVNRRKDAWIIDGIQSFLMMKYVEKYYSEVKAMGNISKIWGVRSYTIAQLNFNDKYPFVYQFAARKNYDQALTTQADSLSNFNRKIVNKYKAGLGFNYLNEYLTDSIVFKSIQQFYSKSLLKKTNSNLFRTLLSQKTDKNLNWFFGDYLHSKKKIDYTIKKIFKTSDSIQITIKNKRNSTVPIALYGIKDKKIQFRKWLTEIDSTATITIAKGNFDRLSLNYENIYPEINLNNNWKNLNPSLLNRPILGRFLKDIDNPYYNQVFYNFEYDYNYYDGLILGVRLTNQTIFKKKWLYKITPTYSTASKNLTGSFSLLFQHLPEETSIYKVRAGIGGRLFHYAPNLSYKSLRPFVGISFKRKSLRDVGGKSLFARYVFIEKETELNAPQLESDKYGVFNLRYSASKPDIIKSLGYSADFQLGENFSKLALVLRYRKLTAKNRQYDFRAFFGTFLHNNTSSTYFNFALDRPSDYLFDYNYLGRSEQSGFLSQQIIISEGGFKTKFANPYANQWMFSTNGSINIWRWIEAYADAGYYKNKGLNPVFRYDSGIRLNFIHNFLEVYFPIQSSLGFELEQPHYSSKIRFVLTLDPKRIYNFVKRGFY